MAKFNKKKLPSRHTSLGPDKAPQRSFYYAMNLTEKDVAKPFVGVVSTWNEAAPCNIALMRQAQSVKKGVSLSGGTPREFCTITVTDGIAMGHEGMKSSLVSRDVIADSTELTVRGHCYDALVGVAGCDKSLPGLMMAMVRLNVPSVFIYGGSILPGRFNGKDVTVEDVFEELLGDFQDEFDITDIESQKLEDGSIIADAKIDWQIFNNKFGKIIPNGDYETIAGFIIHEIGRIPNQGEHIFSDKNSIEYVFKDNIKGVQIQI